MKLPASFRTVMDTVATVAILVTCGILAFSNFTTGKTRPARAESIPPKDPISIADAVTKGNLAAKVVLIQYSDFECPFCSRFARETLPKIDEAYVRTGKVLLAFRHNPLERIHRNAFKAAEAAECAALQGKFWEMHDELFRVPKMLDEPSIVEKASAIALDLPSFSTCLQGQTAAKIRRQSASAGQLGLPQTPTFLIGTTMPDGRVRVSRTISGARQLREFEAALNDLLESAR
jgi:protein-disulfide isomerase